MKLTQLFEQTEVILLEANYNDMFKEYTKVMKDYKINSPQKEAKRIIVNAKRRLKKNDRIVWFLRIAKLMNLQMMFINVTNKAGMEEGRKVLDILHSEIKKYNKKSKGRHITLSTIELLNKNKSVNDLLVDLDHFLYIDIPSINDYIFKWELPEELFIKFQGFEDEWKTMHKRHIRYDEDAKVFLKTGGDFEWIDLENPSCNVEGDAMGHCGNSPASGDSNQTILSLRERIKVKNTVWWKPHATFIYHKSSKSLGEMKGVFNEKPDRVTHKHIVKLLEDKRIEAIHGGGYRASSNFSINDLEEGVANKLIKKKPELLPFMDYMTRFGFDDRVIKRLKKNGLKFINNNDLIIVEEFKDIKDFVSDYGNDTATWIINVDDGNEHLDMWGDGITNKDNIEYNLSSKHLEAIEEYTEKKYPTEYEESGEDWSVTLSSVGDELSNEIETAMLHATESGTQSEMIDALKKEWKESDITRGSDIEFTLYPEEFVWDAPVYITISREDLLKEFKRNPTEDSDTTGELVDYIQSGMDYTLEFIIHSPQYGFDGFDKEYFNELVSHALA